VPLPPFPLPDKLYAVIDGTGVPVTARETAGRDGKGEHGRARTREVKLAVFFTQDKVDDHGYPARDGDSSLHRHAREHLHDLTRHLEFMLGDQKDEWLAARLEDLLSCSSVIAQSRIIPEFVSGRRRCGGARQRRTCAPGARRSPRLSGRTRPPRPRRAG
jgi:hypothetical protein